MDSSVSVVNVARVSTSVKGRKTYPLSPTDYLEGGTYWFAWPLFFDSSIEWPRLLSALLKIEKAYPVLCSRLVADEAHQPCFELDPDRQDSFGVLEIRTEITLEKLRKGTGKMLLEDAGKTPRMNWPLFLDAIDDSRVPCDTGELFGVHLIRGRDGCVLSVATSHALCDGTRYVDLLIDIGRAYRGLDISERHVDRSCFFPDSYLQHFDLPGKTSDMYPRSMSGWAPMFNAKDLCIAYMHLPQV